jgi:hypothetical protein
MIDPLLTLDKGARVPSGVKGSPMRLRHWFRGCYCAPQNKIRRIREISDKPTRNTLSDSVARQLANTTKTAPQLATITPRWLVNLLQWIPLEAGTLRVNLVEGSENVEVALAKRTAR